MINKLKKKKMLESLKKEKKEMVSGESEQEKKAEYLQGEKSAPEELLAELKRKKKK